MAEKPVSGRKPSGLPGLKFLISIGALAGTLIGWAFLALRDPSAISAGGVTSGSSLASLPLPTLVSPPPVLEESVPVSTLATPVPLQPLRVVTAPPRTAVSARPRPVVVTHSS